MVSEITQHRRDFWHHFAQRLPKLDACMVRGNEHSRWLAVGHRPLIIAHYVANGGVGMFVRGQSGERTWRIREFLFPHREFLAERLAQPNLKLGNMLLLPRSTRLDMLDRENWNVACCRFAENSPVYQAILTDLQSNRFDLPEPFAPAGS